MAGLFGWDDRQLPSVGLQLAMGPIRDDLHRGSSLVAGIEMEEVDSWLHPWEIGYHRTRRETTHSKSLERLRDVWQPLIAIEVSPFNPLSTGIEASSQSHANKHGTMHGLLFKVFRIGMVSCVHLIVICVLIKCSQVMSKRQELVH